MQISLAKPPSDNKQKERRRRDQQGRMGRGFGSVLAPVFYIEPVRRPQADNFQPGLATLLLAGPTGRQLCVYLACQQQCQSELGLWLVTV